MKRISNVVERGAEKIAAWVAAEEAARCRESDLVRRAQI